MLFDKNEKQRLMGIKLNNVFVGPECVQVDITNECNLNCIFCKNHSPLVTQHMKGMISFDIFTRLINDLNKLGTEKIILSGMGEPLLHPQINEIFENINKKNIFISLRTNGTLLDKKISQKLVGSNVKEIVINLSSASEKSYEVIHQRRGKLFYKIIKNIKYLNKIKKDESTKLPQIRICNVLNKLNFLEIEDMIKLSTNLGMFPYFRLIDPSEELKKIILNEMEINLLEKMVRSLLKRGENKNFLSKLNFDIVGSNEYWESHDTNETYVNKIKRLKDYGKPVFITEFGAATYEGALGMAGSGWFHAKGKNYSQRAQVKYIELYLNLLREAGVDGSYLFHFKDNYRDRKSSASIIEGNSRKESFYLYKSYQP